MVRPKGCLVSAYSSPYMTSTYFCPAGISFCDEMYFTLGIGRPLCLSDCSETNCFDDDGAGGTGGVAGPLVDLTMMSRVEKPSKNRNAANHQMVDPSNMHCSAIWLFSPVAFCEYAAFCMT